MQEVNRPERRADGIGRIRRKVSAARLVLFWERLWPALLPALGVVSALLIFSLFDFWRIVPAWLHVMLLALAAAALVMTLWRDIRPLRYPSKRAAQERLEADSALRHAPLQSLDDKPADPALAASPLWQAHINASAERARAAKTAAWRETATRRDPFGLRFIMTGLLAIAIISGAQDWRARIASLFAPGANAAGSALADLWIEPPAYTGKAPIYLLRAGDRKSGVQAQIDVPAGAMAIVQINGAGRRTLSFATDHRQMRAKFERDRNAARGVLTLDESGLLELRLAGEKMRWPIGVLPDKAPLVAFSESPHADDQKFVAFSYIAQDDYAIATAVLEMRLDPDQERPLDAPLFDTDTLGNIRAVNLEGTGLSGERAVSLDLQADPWAGLRVLAKVVVTDGAGQTGETEEIGFDLPARTFFNPLAKSVLEQRQTLAIAPEDWRRAGRSLDAVTMAPEYFFDQSTDYLLLRTAFWRVMRQDGNGFADAVEKFWPLALQLEDGAVEIARQRMEAAAEALREAIERGASDEEVARLTEDLRQAMNDYIAALAQAGEQPGGGNGDNQRIDQSSLDEMLDAVRDLAQSGAGNAARQMLSDLENILNNLRMSQSGGGSGTGQGQGAQGEDGAAGQAGDLIGRQRELADEAFERGQEDLGPGEGNADDLANREGGLGSELDDLIETLQGEGGDADPNGEAARSLGRARNNMREAEQALRNGDFDAAASAMERAIAEMREGAEGLAREEMRAAEQGNEDGRGAGMDPLGRPVGKAYGQGVDVPEESDAARSRAIIEELRERLGEPDRDEDEIDYLERLLERF